MGVAVVFSDRDRAIAAELSDGLERSFLEVVGPEQSADGVVVLISAAALTDPAWREQAEAVSARRVVPVRIDALEDSAVPARLKELNWIDWNPERPAATLGFVLAGLFSNPEMYRLSEQMEDEAEAWDQAGRPKGMLVDDRGRARQMKELLAALWLEPMATPKPITVVFVEASDAATRRARRWRTIRRSGVGLVVLAAISAAATVIPAISALSRISNASIVTAGDKSVIEEMPEWSAANAAMLMMEGTPTQRQLGEQTLTEAMSQPWALGTISFVDSILSQVPVADGRRSALLALTPKGSSFGEVDVLHGRLIGFLQLPGKFEQIDVSDDQRVIAVAGEGAGVIPLRTRSFHEVASDGIFAGVRVSGPRLVLWTESGRLETRAVSTGERRLVGTFEAVLDVSADGRGGGTALVASAPGEYAIVDLPSGDPLGTAAIDAGEGVGALAPDGRLAVVDGADEQLWTFGPGRDPEPTGISVPEAIKDLEWASGERLVIASESGLAQVVYLPRSELLASLCSGSPEITEVRLEPNGDAVACGGDARSIWRLPAAPGNAPGTQAQALRATLRSPYAELDIRKQRLQVTVRGSLGSGSSRPDEPFDSDITAAAFSPVDHQFALGSSRGSVMVVGLTRTRMRGVVKWSAPDRSPITGLSWDHGFVATTASGQTWAIPDCRRCQTQAGLIAAARSRFGGCFSARQLSWLDGEARQTLGLIECEPITSLERD